MDNRVFDVNGKGRMMLEKTLELAFIQQGGCYEHNGVLRPGVAKGWIDDKEKGLILLWYTDQVNDAQRFLVPHNAHAATEVVWLWLQDKDNWKNRTFPGTWDVDYDHDGHNGPGWRVYCEGWGHVKNHSAAIVAITPAYMWYGK